MTARLDSVSRFSKLLKVPPQAHTPRNCAKEEERNLHHSTSYITDSSQLLLMASEVECDKCNTLFVTRVGLKMPCERLVVWKMRLPKLLRKPPPAAAGQTQAVGHCHHIPPVFLSGFVCVQARSLFGTLCAVKARTLEGLCWRKLLTLSILFGSPLSAGERNSVIPKDVWVFQGTRFLLSAMLLKLQQQVIDLRLLLIAQSGTPICHGTLFVIA